MKYRYLSFFLLMFLTNYLLSQTIDTISFFNYKTIGPCIDGNINGNGIMLYKNDTIYIGEFKNSLYHGHGKYYTKGFVGDIYDGIFENGNFIYGKYTRYSGSVILYEWEGVWKDMDLIEGTLKYYDNAIYKGTFKNLKPDGFGTLFFADLTQFKGYWKKGKQVKFGVFIDKDKKASKAKYKNKRVIFLDKNNS